VARAGVRAVVLLGACLGAAACGGTQATQAGRHRPAATSVCLTQARTAVARVLRLPVASISTAASTGNNAMPQCTFTARRGDHDRVALTVNVDTSPSPYFRLERTAVEAYQVFTPSRVLPAPQPVNGLGLEAYWFPAQTQLMSTDGVRLITATVSLRHGTRRNEQAIAEAASRPFLRTPHGNVAPLLTQGAPAPP
jgi:hypothetical protein